MTITRQILYRPMGITALIVGTTLIVAVTVLVATSWRSIQRLKPIHAHLNHLNTIQQTSLDLQELMQSAAGASQRVTQRRLAHARAVVASLITDGTYLTPSAVNDLRLIRQQLASGTDLQGELPQALKTLRRVITAENLAKDRLLEDLDRDTHAELVLSSAIIFTLPVVGVLLVFFMRRRIVQPLDSLGHLMTLLAQQDFQTVPTQTIDPLLQPLFNNYNHLVDRLTTLEGEHQMLQHSLKRQVRDATQSLLAQQISLSRAERLAAMGEVAAGLAHELRNPLAGVQMALGNLREDLSEPEQAQRLELMITELKRVTQLMNGLLSQSQVAPEPATKIGLRHTVEDLLTLMRYQVPETIGLQSEIPPGLTCQLPKNGLHQALLNLLINAAQALGDRPGQVVVGAERRGDRLRISVQDDGPGLPEELLKVGARHFVTWRDEGTGLGLAMVKRFAQDLGGELSLTNLEERGACVTIDLPCEETDA